MSDKDKMGPDAQFKAFLSEGKFMIQHGKESGKAAFFPRTVEPGIGGELVWVEASGRGTVYSTTTIFKKPPMHNYNVAVIELEEGVRMMSRVENIDPTEVKIGMAVTARIITQKGEPVVIFVPGDVT
ncbi:MAG: OB-fold domain-containing protein [Syntrophales bacterium]